VKEVKRPDQDTVNKLLAGRGIALSTEPESATKSALTRPEKSSRQQQRFEGALRIQKERASQDQNIGYLARPFLLCGLPFKRPPKEQLIYQRKNGEEVLDIKADPEYGLPFGADIQVPIWVTTKAVRNKQPNGTIPRLIEFETAAEMLNAFGLPLDGRTYKRMQERFLRVFGATIQYGRTSGNRRSVARVHYFDSMDLWFTHDLDTPALPGDGFKNNRIVLSESFARDIERYHPPIELSAVAEWSDAPGQLYFYLWLVWRCYVATKQTFIPLFGSSGVKEQCGAQGYKEHWKFRQMVKRWLGGVKAAWPQCPAALSLDGEYLVIEHGAAIYQRPLRQLR
jgi:hypothetical protein